MTSKNFPILDINMLLQFLPTGNIIDLWLLRKNEVFDQQRKRGLILKNGHEFLLTVCYYVSGVVVCTATLAGKISSLPSLPCLLPLFSAFLHFIPAFGFRGRFSANWWLIKWLLGEKKRKVVVVTPQHIWLPSRQQKNPFICVASSRRK